MRVGLIRCQQTIVPGSYLVNCKHYFQTRVDFATNCFLSDWFQSPHTSKFAAFRILETLTNPLRDHKAASLFEAGRRNGECDNNNNHNDGSNDGEDKAVGDYDDGNDDSDEDEDVNNGKKNDKIFFFIFFELIKKKRKLIFL